MSRLSNRTFSKSNFFRSFSENHFSPRFMLPCSLLAENIFSLFKVGNPSAPTPRYTILDSRLPLVMRSRKAGLPFVTRARKRELSIQEVRIENESAVGNFLSLNFFKVFSENHFSPRFMLPCSLLADVCFVFQRRQPTLDTQFWTRGFPWYCDLGRQASPLQHELGSGSSRYRRYVSRMSRLSEIF